MSRGVLLTVVMLGVCLSGCQSKGDRIFTNYQNIIQKDADGSIVMKKVEKYLVSLNRDDFMSFIREAGQREGYEIDNPDSVVTMSVFATYYMKGPGKNEPLGLLIQQLSDTTLPTSWKLGILDVMQLKKRDNMNEEEITNIISILNKSGQDTRNRDILRVTCFSKLGDYLDTQRERMIKKFPDLEPALTKQDKNILPKNNDGSVMRASELIDNINEYKAGARITIGDIKDKQARKILENSMKRWETLSVTLTK